MSHLFLVSGCDWFSTSLFVRWKDLLMILMLTGHSPELSVPSSHYGMAVFIEEHFKLSHFRSKSIFSEMFENLTTYKKKVHLSLQLQTFIWRATHSESTCYLQIKCCDCSFKETNLKTFEFECLTAGDEVWSVWPGLCSVWTRHTVRDHPYQQEILWSVWSSCDHLSPGNKNIQSPPTEQL